jgi:hypothetical protein
VFYGHLDAQEGSAFIGLLEVQLIKAADSGEQNAILEFLHVTASLAHYSGIIFFLGDMFERQRL